ncbi:MAG TPA: hypothetical protein PLC89_20325 [Haliscomenobacter sp.]|uniref:hypothetical protein n=1 Tax=Haliscomenobacter sp. TaxID=2717303 RepID=UPI002C6F2357|nr:hypothetical protein [Haliscomenobacter sp.]HOY19670.1 hypothetical protein [Haliscomenobacter sp.]
MENWKNVAKKHIANNEILKCLTVIKKHGIITSGFVARFKKHKKMEDKVLSEKRTYTSAEYAAKNKIHSELAWDIMQAIDGTTREMPDYLK